LLLDLAKNSLHIESKPFGFFAMPKNRWFFKQINHFFDFTSRRYWSWM